MKIDPDAHGFWVLNVDSIGFAVVLGALLLFFMIRVGRKANTGVQTGLLNFVEMLVLEQTEKPGQGSLPARQFAGGAAGADDLRLDPADEFHGCGADRLAALYRRACLRPASSAYRAQHRHQHHLRPVAVGVRADVHLQLCLQGPDRPDQGIPHPSVLRAVRPADGAERAADPGEPDPAHRRGNRPPGVAGAATVRQPVRRRADLRADRGAAVAVTHRRRRRRLPLVGGRLRVEPVPGLSST